MSADLATNFFLIKKTLEALKVANLTVTRLSQGRT
jgi:hypothetical protein